MRAIPFVILLTLACGGGRAGTASDPGGGGPGSQALAWEPVRASVADVTLGAPPQPALPEDASVAGLALGRWTWEAPTPFGYAVNDVWAQSSTVVDVAPAESLPSGPALLHYDGASWTTTPLPPGVGAAKQLSLGGGKLFALTTDGHVLRPVGGGYVDLNAPFAATHFVAVEDQDVWAFAVSGGALVAANWNGFAWTQTTLAASVSGRTRSAWASSPTDVWLALAGPVSGYHWNGSAWTAVDIPVIDGSSRLGNYFGLKDTAFFHDGGTGWQPAGGASVSLPVWADTANGGFGAGLGIMRFDGAAWSQAVSLPRPVTALRGAATNDVWAFARGDVLHYDGSAWSRRGSRPSVSGGLVACGGSDLWAVDATGLVLHRATRWTPAGTLPSTGIAAVASTASEVWAAGDGLFRFDGAKWTAIDLGTRGPFADVTASTGTVIVTAQDGTVYRGLSGAWARLARAGAVSAWASGADDVWIASPASVLHWNGGGFERHDDWKGYTRVRGAGPGDVWLAGSTGLAHWNGALGTVLPDASAVAVGGGRVVAVRVNGAVTQVLPATQELGAIGATAACVDGAHVWASGDARIVRYDF